MIEISLLLLFIPLVKMGKKLVNFIGLTAGVTRFYVGFKNIEEIVEDFRKKWMNLIILLVIIVIILIILEIIVIQIIQII